MPWELLLAQLPTLVLLAAAALRMEHRITRIERDLFWISQCVTQNKQDTNGPHRSPPN